jgi:hypothetical protein
MRCDTCRAIVTSCSTMTTVMPSPVMVGMAA